VTNDSRTGFRIGDWEVFPQENLLKGPLGDRVLEPKVMDLLVHLASRPNAVVSRDELLESVWADVIVGDEALSRAISVLRAQLGDDKKNPQYVRTISKRGYQLVAEVDPFPPEASPVRGAFPAQSGSEAVRGLHLARRFRRPLVLGAGVFATALTMLALVLTRQIDSGARERMMIVVLPFENLGSPEDEYFADGMTDEITSRLSRVGGLGVISRYSAAQYRSTQATAQIGKELGVDYFVAGTVRWSRLADGGSRLRVTPRLVRIADDTVMWSQSYDRALRDVFDIQSSISVQVVNELGVKLGKEEALAIEKLPTANLDAYQAYLRATINPLENCRRRRNLNLDRAVELDPGFLNAWARLSSWHSNMIRACPALAEYHEAEARRTLARALQLDPRSAVTLGASAALAMRTGDYEGAMTWLEAAGDRVESSSYLLERKGAILRRQGRWQEAIEAYKMAVALDPRNGWLAHALAVTHTWVRDYPAAEAEFDRSISLGPVIDDYQLKAEVLWLWRGDTQSARDVLEGVPDERQDGASIRWAWYWQEIYEGNYRSALEGLADLPADALRTTLHSWPTVLHEAIAQNLLGELDRSRESFEAARRLLEDRVEASPSDERSRRALAIALAGLGRSEEALTQNRLAQANYPLESHPWFGTEPIQNLAYVLTMTGDYGGALEQLEFLLSRPAKLSVPLLELDPRWAPLREHPRFAELKDTYGPAH
jgi:TolB-like protein/DNA-binding winged helix-turn-helix (wHTH) protein/Flp pilus assembly protein TadD